MWIDGVVWLGWLSCDGSCRYIAESPMVIVDHDESRFVVSDLLAHALVLTVKHGLVIVLLGYVLGLVAVLTAGLVSSENLK